MSENPVMIESCDTDWASFPVVTPPVYRELVTTGAVQSVCIRSVGDDARLIVVLRVGNQNPVLGMQRGLAPRYFHSLDGVASVLAQAGITEWTAKIENWIPRTLKYQQRAEKKEQVTRQ